MHTSYFRTGLITLSILFCTLACPGLFAEGKILWQIGQSDNNTAEFALAPDQHNQYPSRFPSEPMFVVGKSDPKKDFPYCQPGPVDGWAGSKSHTFTIVFGIAAIPTDGDCRLMLDLVDTQGAHPPKMEIGINDRTFTRSTPAGAGDASIMGQPDKGREHVVTAAFGSSALQTGNNTITITTLDGSWVLYDYLSLTVPADVEPAAIQKATQITRVYADPCLVRQGDRLYQPVLATLMHIGDPAKASLAVGDTVSQEYSLVSGTQTIEMLTPEVDKPTGIKAFVRVDGRTVAEKALTLKPVRKWVIYMLHQTHLDIGYTHVQTDVEKMQWSFLEQAIELGEKTKDYPAEARFKWLPEGLWAVDSYLKNATPEKQTRLIDAVRKGYISFDALYGNELTALCRPEELLELTGCARRLAKKYDLTIDSAMITDVPGYTWGLIEVLSQSGVRYLSIGPNSGHRIGYTLSEWGDKPFYWQTPSGRDKVLCWMAGMGYSWFHTGLNYKKIDRKLDAARIFDYLKRLEDKGFPYDIVQVRYNIGSDNGPPDPLLPDIVKAWNEKYAYPKMIIASPSEMFRDFESRYADKVPTVRGDFTPYWEDGAASSARETALNRAAAERIVQAQTLYAMLAPDKYPAEEFHDAYRDAVLYDEHTWGSYNSISEPEGDFTKNQWKIKQAFALEADRRSRELLAKAVEGVSDDHSPVRTVRVFNTCSWTRSDLAVCPPEMTLTGDQVRMGEPIPSQRLANGQLVFRIDNLPAFADVCLTFHDGKPAAKGSARADGNTLSNGIIKLTIDKNTGAMASLACKGIDGDLVDAKGGAVNSYSYVEGRDPKAPAANGPVSIRVADNGPLVATLVVESDAPGCNRLVRTYRVIDGMDYVEVIDLIDKKNIYTQEAVHLGFAFNVPDGVLRMETPWAVVRPETDQLPGACKNYFTVQRWVDISNDNLGVTCATVDAPLIEIGGITNDPRSSVGWIKKLEPSSTFYSYVMNNYWETNYKASQSGEHVFRYYIQPHKKYDPAEATRFAVGTSQPLIVVPCDSDRKASAPLLEISPAGVIATTLKPADDGTGLVLRLFNTSDRKERVNVRLGALESGNIMMSNLNEDTLSKVKGAIEMSPWEVTTLRIVR